MMKASVAPRPCSRLLAPARAADQGRAHLQYLRPPDAAQRRPCGVVFHRTGPQGRSHRRVRRWRTNPVVLLCRRSRRGDHPTDVDRRFVYRTRQPRQQFGIHDPGAGRKGHQVHELPIKTDIQAAAAGRSAATPARSFPRQGAAGMAAEGRTRRWAEGDDRLFQAHAGRWVTCRIGMPSGTAMMPPPHERADPGLIEAACTRVSPRLALSVLIAFFAVLSCGSLVVVSHYQAHILFDSSRLSYAIASATAFYLISFLFVFTRFSFGYFVGFPLYGMMLGFVWLGSFSRFPYDHKLAALSAAASAVLFLLPALLINAPFEKAFALTVRHLERLLDAILLLSLTTIAVASSYNFRLTSLDHIYDYRNELYFP